MTLSISDAYQQYLNMKRYTAQSKPQQSQPSKINILAWTDSPTTTTGFGVVAKYVLNGLYKTGKFNVDVLAINYFERLDELDRCPYHLYPARLDNPKDPYGKQTFLGLLQSGKYQVAWVQNDPFILTDIASKMIEVQGELAKHGKPFGSIFYYPVDCRLRPSWNPMVNLSDKSIGYSKFTEQETLKVPGTKCDGVIPIGVNTKVFKPLSPEDRTQWRQQYFHILPNQNTYVVMNVNRNSLRKDLAKTIYCFSEFKKLHPEAILYLHTAIVDAGAGSPLVIDLNIAIEHLGLQIGKDIIFPSNFNPPKGISEVELNRLYNCADCFITTDLGEGTGITRQEAMAAGTPVIVPNSTVTPEQLGSNLERGYVYECREMISIDLSGYRPAGRIEDIVKSMEECYVHSKTQEGFELRQRARQYAENIDWENIYPMWYKVFDEILEGLSKPKMNLGGVSL